eukprot:2363909-Rhodomonas_salina.2
MPSSEARTLVIETSPKRDIENDHVVASSTAPATPTPSSTPWIVRGPSKRRVCASMNFSPSSASMNCMPPCLFSATVGATCTLSCIQCFWMNSVVSSSPS